jgi:hypothetical protein
VVVVLQLLPLFISNPILMVVVLQLLPLFISNPILMVVDLQLFPLFLFSSCSRCSSAIQS